MFRVNETIVNDTEDVTKVWWQLKGGEPFEGSFFFLDPKGGRAVREFPLGSIHEMCARHRPYGRVTCKEVMGATMTVPISEIIKTGQKKEGIQGLNRRGKFVWEPKFIPSGANKPKPDAASSMELDHYDESFILCVFALAAFMLALFGSRISCGLRKPAEGVQKPLISVQ
eukprot:gnl/MRDRNA2_/MRDRNA2_74770_c0_seq1.p1 gnl/MRDRNA2_/MRDRNA2_74770_c0~~gnl/MRDRNA2_/MRDRNA2_74770_c0_seq1.p1  ORF type:complete len:170 (+),score=25.26 gnl/MRDRNA2_/MRDRNA2_74770_c0_seq1:128-637(+)